jgi:hypothetical protein
MKVRPWCAAMAACVLVGSACREDDAGRTSGTQARGTTTTPSTTTTTPSKTEQPSTTRPGIDRGTQPATAPRDTTGTTGTTGQTGQTGSTTGQAGTGQQTGDLSGLDPQVLATRARTMIQDCRMQIEGVDDAQGARAAVTRCEPMVDQLVEVKSELESQNVDLESLTSAAEEARTRLAGNQDALDALKPLLTKIEELEEP